MFSRRINLNIFRKRRAEVPSMLAVKALLSSNIVDYFILGKAQYKAYKI